MKLRHLALATAAILLLLISSLAIAQRVEVTDGSLDALKGIKKMNIRYDYNDMSVGKKSEKDYVDEKTDAYNKKEAGKGDKWAKDWKADREGRYEPSFEEGFNKNGDIQVGYNPKEKYTLIFKTVFTEPGFNIGVMRKSAYIDGAAWIVETTDQSKVIAKLEVKKCPGRTIMGDDFDTGERIMEAYAAAGRALARYLRKNAE
jgi:hypothetical protein